MAVTYAERRAEILKRASSPATDTSSAGESSGDTNPSTGAAPTGTPVARADTSTGEGNSSTTKSTTDAAAGSDQSASGTAEAGQPSKDGATGEDGTSGAPSGTATLADWTKWAEDKTPDQIRSALLSDRRTAGIMGQMADEIARGLDAKNRQESDQRRQQEELERLKTTNPNEYIRRTDALRAQQERDSTIVTETRNDAYAAITSFASGLPDEIQTALSGKVYNSHQLWRDNFRDYLKDVYEAGVKHARTSATAADTEAAVAAAREKWEKEELPDKLKAYRKEVLAEVNGRRNGAIAPEVDTGSHSSAAGTGPVDQEEWVAHRDDRRWRQANRDRINDGIAKGLILG